MKFAPVLAVLLLGSAHAAPTALGDNEQLTYRVSWAILPGVGRITVTARTLIGVDGRPELKVSTETQSRGLGYLILPFDARADSLYDRSNGLLLQFNEASSTRSRSAAHTMIVDYTHRRVLYTEAGRAGGPRSLPLPPGDPSDLISSLLLARTWNLVPGETHDALVFFEDQFYQLTLHAIRYEDVLTPLGTFRTLMLEPRMDKTPPAGMFRRGSSVKVWIAQSGAHLPVRFQVQFNFGSGVATLIDYRPPIAVSAVPRPALPPAHK